MRQLGWLVTGVVLMVAAPAFAQDTSRGEFSAGWRYYHVTMSTFQNTFELKQPNDYPEGWYADVAVHVSPKFAIVGEAGGTYHTDNMSRTTGSFTTEESLKLEFHTFMGGVRVRAPQLRAFVPFGQVLFGGERDKNRVERTTRFSATQNPSTTRRDTVSSNSVLALDGGVTMMASGFAVRASVGYVRFFGRADADAFRLNLGAGFRF
jgi:hypothetical protein